jgi:hypothetical protein
MADPFLIASGQRCLSHTAQNIIQHDTAKASTGRNASIPANRKNPWKWVGRFDIIEFLLD